MPWVQNYSNYSNVTSPESTTDVPDLAGLVRLTHHRWVIPLVAAIGRGQRFAVLQTRLGVARQTLRRAIEAADGLGLVLRNPGYGHPLRPEYVLAPEGERVRPACAAVVTRAVELDGEELIARKWVLPTLAAQDVSNTPLHFHELAARLPGISPAALTGTLDALVHGGWLRRPQTAARPGHSPYALEAKAKRLAATAVQLAQLAEHGADPGAGGP